MADVAQKQAVKIVDPTTDANEVAVDASGNLQVILAANTGVDIGDVDVTSIIPGVGVTNLGKAVDDIRGAADVGVAILAVRDDALAALSEAANDYVQLRTDANGALWTHDDALDAALVGSELQVDIVAPLPTGTNEIGDIRAITTSITPGVGNLFLGKAENVAIAAGDVGVATMAVQDAVLSALGSVDDDYTQLRVNANGALWVEQVAGGSGTSATDSDPFTVATDSYTPVGGIFDDAAPGDLVEGDGGAVRMSAVREMYTNIRDGAGGERSANVTAAFELNVIATAQPGVDIGDVDVLSVIPGVGPTNLGKAEDAAHVTADTGVMLLAVRRDADTAMVDADNDYTPLQTDVNGRLKVETQGSGGGTSEVDSAVFAPTTDSYTPIGGIFDDVTPSDLTENDGGVVRMSAVREMYMNIRDGAGGERSANVTAANELNVILGSNTGVDIGDVDVLSVIPGTAATNLGKAEDVAHATGDTGVAIWGVRNDANATTFSDTDLDYTPLAVDAQGNLQVDILTGGGSDTPAGEAADHTSSTNTAAGGVFEVDSADFGAATKKLAGAEFSASVPLKCEVMSVDDGAETVLTTLFSQAGDSVVWRPPHRDYFEVAFTANAGFDGFRLQITNQDNSQAADVYGTVYSED